MKDINNFVKQFKKENKIIFLTWHKLLRIAKKNNWKLKPFSKAKKLIQEHKLEKYVKKHRAFVYEYADEIIILYRDNLKGYNRLYTISHEIGHIYLGHTLVLDKSEDEEIEADEFAGLLLSGYKKPIAALLVLISALVSIACFLTLPDAVPEDNIHKIKEIPTEITETIAEPTIEATEALTEEFTEYNKKMYYVSKSGKKYHLKDCNYIDADECTKLTLEEVKKLGYEPCKVCKPDKYN